MKGKPMNYQALIERMREEKPEVKEEVKE